MAEYRTLIQASIVQTTALAVGGSSPDGNPDACYRDGLGRLTIPGTGLAGALVETAARLFPALIGGNGVPLLLDGRITGKQQKAPSRQGHGDDEDAVFLQSVWHFRNAHPRPESPATEWRQGVGIRQATGATARRKKALYDFELVPTGANWDFLLEIDTFRGGAAAEAAAVLALQEWVAGRGWLGRGAARGTGWFQLDGSQAYRLSTSTAELQAWPNNTQSVDEAIQAAVAAGGQKIDWKAALADARPVAAASGLHPGTWHYLTLPVSIEAGRGADGYGWNALHVGGHPAGELDPSSTGLLEPLSVPPLSVQRSAGQWRGGEYKRPDAPLVTTQPSGAAETQPFLPGSSLRGPLRHAASRLARALGEKVRDPNDPDDAEAERLRPDPKKLPSGASAASQDEIRQMVDRVTAMFGAEELGGRILVQDGALAGRDFKIARLEHHAEDEFTAGVYGGGKFDCDVLLAGAMSFRIVLEAPSLEDLQAMVQPLAPALELARLGQLPLGGGKWRGAGWLPWTFGPMELVCAGSGRERLERQEALPVPVPRRLQQLLTPL